MMEINKNAVGSLATALEHSMVLLQEKQYFLAQLQAESILEEIPSESGALYILAISLRLQNKLTQALAVTDDLIKQAVGQADAHYEQAFVLSLLFRDNEALEAIEKSLSIDKHRASFWKLRAEILQRQERDDESSVALQKYIKYSSHSPDLIAAVNLLMEKKLAKAENLLRRYLKSNPKDVNAIRLLAEVGMKLGIYADAERLLERCLKITPEFHLARFEYALALQKRQKSVQAIEQLDILLTIDPKHPGYRTRKATCYAHIGQYDRACELFLSVIEDYPDNGQLYVSYGHALKTIGEQEQAIQAYRKAIALNISVGEAYWSLANLKTVKFDDPDVENMQRLEADEQCQPIDKYHLCFALAKALEDKENFDSSFHYYDKGNRLKKKELKYNADDNNSMILRTINSCDAKLFDGSSHGYLDPAPIFIVGLPRSGSTLLEQILSSHSMVDGTKELPDIIALAQRLSGKIKATDPSLYPEILCDLSPEQLKSLGEEYIERVKIQRGDAPYFIDKMPNNFAHIGLIHLILPKARIIDARRNPMASSFSCFKQLFALGQNFTYGLDDIGHYFRNYLMLMDHWHKMLPGKILTVNYEEIVQDFDNQVTTILDYCGLPLEKSCFTFYDTKRAIRTASSEQVRQPIFTSGLDQWSHFSKHLDPLRQALGQDVIERFNI